MIDTGKLFRAPVPGENLTVNSKNYAWHKPPQFPKYDDAFEFFVDEFFGNNERINSAAVMASFGINALSITQTLMLNAVGGGRISPDMSLLLAGPVYKTLVNTFDRLGVKYLSGFDSPEELKEFVDYLKSPSQQKAKKADALTAAQRQEMEELSKEVKEKDNIPTGGLMGASAEDEEKVEIPAEFTGSGLVPEREAEEQEGES